MARLFRACTEAALPACSPAWAARTPIHLECENNTLTGGSVYSLALYDRWETTGCLQAPTSVPLSAGIRRQEGSHVRQRITTPPKKGFAGPAVPIILQIRGCLGLHSASLYSPIHAILPARAPGGRQGAPAAGGTVHTSGKSSRLTYGANARVLAPGGATAPSAPPQIVQQGRRPALCARANAAAKTSRAVRRSGGEWAVGA